MENESELEVVEFTAPTHWACALINGDTSGLSDEDMAAFNACIADLDERYGDASIVDVEDIGFMSGDWMDYGGPLAGNYATYSMLV